MKLEVLMSCMDQNDDVLVRRAGLTGDVVVINQCDRDGFECYPTRDGFARMFFTRQRGLTRSRNLAMEKSMADICLLCDDDETFISDYPRRILDTYQSLPEADVLILKMENRPASFPDRILRLRFPLTMKVSSWQISFRRERVMAAGVRFDELLGAGTGNGAEEELKFLTDCQRAGLRIFYAPVAIASVAQTASTWFHGYDEDFFENRGATTRYILGAGIASVYAVYYIVCKRRLYCEAIRPSQALRATFRGIRENKIKKQADAREKAPLAAVGEL